jgi:hypothetical protein
MKCALFLQVAVHILTTGSPRTHYLSLPCIALGLHTAPQHRHFRGENTSYEQGMVSRDTAHVTPGDFGSLPSPPVEASNSESDRH